MDHEHDDVPLLMGPGKPKDQQVVWVCRVCHRIEEPTTAELLRLRGWGVAV